MRAPEHADIGHILLHAPLSELANAHLFLAGGTGFLGIWLTKSFLAANDTLGLGSRITLLTRRPDIFLQKFPELKDHPSLTLLHGDIRTCEFPADRFTHIINAATDTDVRIIKEHPEEIIATIVDGTKRSLDSMSMSGASKYLLLSSGAVYGPQSPGRPLLREDDSTTTLLSGTYMPYSDGKRAAEKLCIASGATVARGFTFVGPNVPLDRNYAIGNFIGDAMAERPILLQGDGTTVRSYLHTADAAAWLWTILLKGKPGRVYNVGSDDARPLAEIAELVAGNFHPSPGVRIAKTHDPAKSIERYVPSIERAKTELGLDVWIGLPEAINRTITAILP